MLIGIVLLVVGVPLALPLIVLTWLAAFFPIIGAIVAGAAAVLVALVANGPTEALIVLVAIIVVQQVEGNVLYPVVVGPRLQPAPGRRARGGRDGRHAGRYPGRVPRRPDRDRRAAR